MDKAVSNALQAYEDGIYRVFLNDRELTCLDENINLKEKDSLTFIRLTMLAGVSVGLLLLYCPYE